MTKQETLGIQLVSDLKQMEEDVASGLYKENPEGLIENLKRLNDKMKEWQKEADRIIAEAEAIQAQVESIEE